MVWRSITASLVFKTLNRMEEEEMARKKPMAWEQRRQLLVEREQQRRYGDAHRGLERS